MFEQDARSTNSSEQTVLRASSSEEIFEQDAQSTVLELFNITSYEQMSDTLRARSSEYVQALFNCKILDPACGSGAYPMGVLHKMVALMTILDPKNEHLKEIEGKKLDDLIKSAHKLSNTNTRNQTIEALQKQKEILQKAEYDYVRKLYIIENCIYGVDIQSIAIQISKLRFFISLLVEQTKNNDLDNMGIEPLPNMDFKLVAANTLIAPPQEDKGTGMFENHNEFFENFEQLAHDYFTLHTPESKKAKKDEIEILINEKVAEKKKLIASVSNNKNLEQSVALWESYQNIFKDKAVGFFDIPYFFPKVKDGFDVVIGNPPYGADIDELIPILKKLYPRTSKGFRDIYKYFFDSGLSNLSNKESGLLCYITPNTYLMQPRYKDLREFLLLYKSITIIDLGENVFDAVVPTAITLVSSANNKSFKIAKLTIENNLSNLLFVDLKKEDILSKGNLIFEDNHTVLKDDEVRLENVLEMKDGGINYQRVNIGLSEKGKSNLSARLFYEGKKLEAKDCEYFKGQDINSFFMKESTNRFCKTNIKLEKNERVIINHKYFIAKPKLIWRQTASYFIGTIDKNGKYWGRSIQGGTIYQKYKEITYEYLLALLNSKYLRYIYDLSVRETGRVFPQVKLEKLKPLPIKILKPTAQQPFIDLVNKILQDKKIGNDTTALEHQIDVMVYHLYGLSYQEACVIDDALKVADFEKYKIEI